MNELIIYIATAIICMDFIIFIQNIIIYYHLKRSNMTIEKSIIYATQKKGRNHKPVPGKDN